MTQRNARKQDWVFPLFSPDSDDRLSLNFHRFVILYISCDTRSVGLGQYCLPKVYIGFKNDLCQIVLSHVSTNTCHNLKHIKPTSTTCESYFILYKKLKKRTITVRHGLLLIYY